ncbi:SMI1/KNR4 family protein [Streptomyces sp. NPDC102441]|uniref:Lsr2 family DNA-binding protein n=1 Tax=Streptomyces sp. NPDC102441 TaxID=3366176 RepID=UPI003803213F
MAGITALTQLCPPPGQAMNSHWQAVEASLGMSLPQDYKQLADRYGPGVFNDYVHVYHPQGMTEFVNLTGPMPGRIRAQLRKDDEQGTHPVPYDPETLFACAGTDNGEYLFWITDPAADPDHWRIAVNEARGPGWFTYDGTLTAFLTAVLGGQAQVPLFPAGLVEPSARFAPARPVLREPAPLAGSRPVDTRSIRSWARAHGYAVPPRGRIPLGVRDAWERRKPTE